MALVSVAFPVCVMIVCWSQLSSSDNSCPCPEIPKLNLTNLPQQGCFEIDARFRYKCMDGYLRKAGTSNLIKCENPGAQWSKPSLVCIPDPRITTTQPPKATSTTTESHTDISSYSVSTSAITTASTAQMMQNSSTVLEQGTSTQTTIHEPVMETTGQTDTIKNTTHSALGIDAAADSTRTTAATVVTVLLVTLCTAGLVLLYQRRRREHTPVNQDPEELCTLNA
ncbi:interleukin-15 receptor subunit alpha isoform X2 [Haplochromis burtoni]|uniref:Interleukin 15 receptor subunit alpha n=1 Tax=Haplochromis burtoni TaxID=8153 RepID=A0A3Q2WXF7_HAPBU|nr:interleukin-15 receptor subunit alpha isoform X2 [Haplochromis burtoni]